ncbi:IS1182 family transposase [Helcococcus ovis]|uniref:IS1182 family transposase n=1 Tax=Helcococcus ovis TaxID=72026 RepID=UPI0038BDC048
MSKHNNYQEKLTLNRSVLQVKMNFNTELSFVDDGKVGLVQDLVERMDLDKLVRMYSKYGRKPIVDPITMLKVLIFCYSSRIYSSRDIEVACNYDLRVKYLLEDQKAPDHATINRYRKKLEPIIEDIFAQFTNILIEDEHVDLSSIYIDGTKIEAYANKYTFVWKKSVFKYQEKLKIKIINHFNLDKSIDLTKAKSVLKMKFKEISKHVDISEFVYGKGKRKTQIQRDYELYKSWLEKLEEYEYHLEIMGERNSYSKTDHDATFMRMKDDHMMNGQLKPGYNIQLATNGQFIIDVYGSHHPNDMNILPLFLDKLYPKYYNYLDRIVCDSGYESLENYTYLKDHCLSAFIKPSNYEISKKKSYIKDISKRENMEYVEDGDYYICANDKKLVREKDRTRVRKSGFRETDKVYKCYECDNCPHQKACNKYSKTENPQTKRIQFNEDFLNFRKESYENITSEEGINERLNRSIQAEGAFSKIKEAMGYDRFRHRGLKSILCDTYLLAMGLNLNQLHRKLLKKQTQIIKYKKIA